MKTVSCKLLAVSCLLLAVCGCVREKVVVVNEPMVPVRLEYEGTPGWWLSDSLYEATLLRMMNYE